MLDSVSIKQVKIKIGELCKLNRQSRNLSQEALAEKLGMSRLTIQKLESGKNVTLDTLLKVANHFELLDKIYQQLEKNSGDNEIKSLY